MATRIKLKRSEIPTAVPTTNDLQQGEVAMNTVDKKIYARDGFGIIREVANSGPSDAEVTTKATIMAIALG